MRVTRLLLTAALLVTLAPPASAAEAPRPKDFGPTPVQADCRDYPGQTCVQDPWTGKLTVGTRVVREGEEVTFSVSLEPGGVSFSLPEDGCSTKTVNKEVEVKNADGVWERKPQDVPNSATCTFKAGSTGGKWATVSSSIVGPCGSQIAVQQGRAEYASCAGTYASDYYGVIDKDDDRFGISGRISLSDGRGMQGVPVSVSGPDSDSTVTGPLGDYYFLVKEGDYTVTADAEVCAEPQGETCENSREVSVGGSKTVDFRPEGEGAIEGTVLGADSKPKSGVTVRVVGKDGITVVTDGSGHYKARVPKGSYVLSASQTNPPTKEGEKAVIDTYCADNSGSSAAKCRETIPVEVPPDKKVNWKLKGRPDGVKLDLKGEVVVEGKTFAIKLGITNPHDQALSNVAFADGAALVTTQVGSPPSPSITQLWGPNAPLPLALAPHETKTLTYRFATGSVGDAVLSSNVSATLPDKKVVQGTQGLTVSVAGKAPTKEQLQAATADGLSQVLGLASANQREVDKMIATTAARRLDLKQPTPADISAGRALGLPPELAGILRQKVAEQKAFWDGYGNEFARRTDEFGQNGGKFLANVVATLEDPVSRRELGNKIVAGASELSKASLENLGYLGQAILATGTPSGIKTIISTNAQMVGDVTTALNEVRMGIPVLMEQADEAYKNDPVGYNRELGKTWGGATFEGVKEASLGALGEVGVRGIVAIAPKALEAAGLSRLASSTDEVSAAANGAEELLGVEGGAEALRRVERAEQAFKTVQELPYGTVLDAETLVAKGGIAAADAAEIQSIVRDVNKLFGVEFEIGARTSEPLSAAIDGVAKREFVKPKAVSVLDMLLGADERVAGRASVYKPTMPGDEALAGLEARQPGITQKLKTRLADQDKLNTEYLDPNSALRQLVDASGTAAGRNGVTALVERPGFTFPQELAKQAGKPTFAYLEQLKDSKFLQSRRISKGRAEELYTQLSKFPDSSKTKLVATKVGNTTTFREALQGGKSIVSDLDLQLARPKSGVWPAGKQSQIETYVNSRMKKISRFPNHGWSDAATDVPSAIAEVAAKFKLATTVPELGPAAAKEFERQFTTMAKHIRDKAALTADEGARAKLLEQAQKLEALTADALLKKYPPGEKIILFDGAEATVGGSTGGR